MKVHCICPLCGSEAEKDSTLKCTIFYCSKCKEFEINTFENEPTLSDEDKQILSNYFINSDSFNSLRKKIITKDNYKEIVAFCKESLS